MDAMLKSVARTFRWTPDQLSLLYLDEHEDGLEYWYNDCRDQAREIREATKK